MLVNACVTGDIVLSSIAQDDVSSGSGFNDCGTADNWLMRSFDFCTRVQPRPINLATIGRPDVGKSTLLDKIVRNDRVLTGPVYVMCVDLALVHYPLT